MSLAAFLPLRSPYPHQRSPPDAFSPRVTFSPRPALTPMSRVPRIETASSSRRANNLPRDPSDWVDKDLLSYVRFNYSSIEAVSLSEVIERDRLTPTALWYLQAEPEQLLAIAEEESLRDTLLGLALSLKPAVSPTSPRIRHVRRLSEDLERPPPPPPPPPPSPPTPEEPELEEDNDVAESVVSDWALDEDLGDDDDDGPTSPMDDLGDLTGPTAQPEPPLEGLGLHTGEPRLDDVTSHTQPGPVETDDLIDLEDDLQPTVPQEEGPEPHSTRTDTGADDNPAAEEAVSSEGASTDAHGPDAAGEKPTAATHHADPSAPSDEPSTSGDAAAGMPADHSNTFTSPLEDDDVGNPLAEDTSGSEPSPPPPSADRARTSSPTSDYHDANSTHGDEGEREEALLTEREPESSPVHPREGDGLAASSDEHESPPEAPLPSETPDKGEPEENVSSGKDAPTHEEETHPEEHSAPASSENSVQTPLPATDPIPTMDPVQSTDPVQTVDPVHPIDPVQPTDDVQGRPSVTDPAQPSPPVTEPISAPPQGDAQNQEEHIPAADPECDEPAHAGPDDSKDTQPEEPSVPSVTTGITTPEQSQENAEVKGDESGQPSGEEGVFTFGEVDNVRKETGDKVDEEAVDKVDKDEEATVLANGTPEPAETIEPSAATVHTVDDSPEESADGATSGVQPNEQAWTSETPATQPEAEADSPSPTQGEVTLEESPVPLEASVTESTPSPLPLTDDTATATTAIDVPPSPTVRLASGIEAQLVERDPESTEQTPSASPSDTPPNTSPSPSESRQTSPPAEAKADKPAPPDTRVHIPSTSSVSSVNPVERKPPSPPPIATAFGSLSEPSRHTRSADPLPDNAWQHSSAFQPTLSSAPAKSVTWGSAQSPSIKGTRSWGGRMLSSVTSSLFGSPSEPSTRDSSEERETVSSHMPVSPAPVPSRASPAIRPSPWDQNKKWSAVASLSASDQQASKLKSPPVPAAELATNVRSARVSPLTDTIGNNKASISTSSPASVPLPSERSTHQETNSQAEEVTDVISDSVLIDSGTPSAGNGEPARDAQVPTVQAMAPSQGDSSDAGGTGDKEETKDAEDNDLVKVTASDVADADKEAVSESQPQGHMDVDVDDDENQPLNLRLERVRQVTGDSLSSALTSDGEIEDNNEGPGQRTGPRLQTSGIAIERDGVGSPAVESPITPSTPQSKSKKRKKNKKSKSQGPS